MFKNLVLFCHLFFLTLMIGLKNYVCHRDRDGKDQILNEK
jgi:hypothetical protein